MGREDPFKAMDAAYQGGSEGEPRNVDSPSQWVEDIYQAADIITAFPGVDQERLGILGICGGGYTIKAVQTDKRFKAVATLSMFNSGEVRRNGFMNGQTDTVQERILEAVAARQQEAAGGAIKYISNMLVDLTEEANELAYDLYKEGYFYYGKTHAHPKSTFSYTVSSQMELISFDAADQAELISQPLLMIAGSTADTLYLTERVYGAATGTQDKEIFLIEGATHIETYWVPEYVTEAVERLSTFFGDHL